MANDTYDKTLSDFQERKKLSDSYYNNDTTTSEPTDADILKDLVKHGKLEKDISQLNKVVGELSPDKNSPVNSLDDLLTRYQEMSKKRTMTDKVGDLLPNTQLIENNNFVDLNKRDSNIPLPPKLNGPNMSPMEQPQPLTNPDTLVSELANLDLGNKKIEPNMSVGEPAKFSTIPNQNLPQENNQGLKLPNAPKSNLGNKPNTEVKLDPMDEIRRLLAKRQEQDSAQQRELADANQQRDINAALGMITSGVSQAAAGYGGGSITQLKGDTKAQEMLKQTADAKIADIKEKMKGASESEKRLLESQLTLAQIQKMRDENSYNNKKLQLERDKIASDERIAGMRNKEDSKVKLSPDEVKMYAENRKTLKEINKDELTTKELLKDVQDAKKALIDYGKKNAGGTGWFSQAGGLRSKVSQDAENLESKLSNLSLDTLVKKFQGMSRAVDTERDRAEFEKTVPTMMRDDATNLERLNRMEELTKNMLNKQTTTKNMYTREGRFKTPEESQQESVQPQQSIGPYGQEVEKNGKMYIWNPSVGKYQIK